MPTIEQIQAMLLRSRRCPAAEPIAAALPGTTATP
jgi:hypothetical protein